MNREDRRKIEYKKIWKMVKPSVKSAWRVIPFIILFGALEALLTIAEPYIFGSVVDSIIASVDAEATVSQALQSLSPWLIGWSVVLVFGTIFAALHMYMTWRSGNLQLMNLLSRWLDKIYALDLRRFETSRSGELLKRIDKAWDGFWRVHEFFLMKFLRSIFIFSSAIILGSMIDWRFTLIALAPVPLIIIIGLYNLRTAETVQDEINEKWESITGFIGDTIANIATVKSFVEEAKRVHKVTRKYRQAFVQQMRINTRWSSAYASYGGLYTAGRFLLFVFGTVFIVQGSVTVGVLIMFLGFLHQIYWSVQTIVNELPYLLEAFSRLSRVGKLFYEIPDVQDQPGAKALRKFKGEVVFDHVSFSYQDGKKVLQDVSFVVPDGQTFALVGESGAGKSTLAKTMLRFHDPQKGSIFIDGKDICDVTLSSLRKNVGLVMQENMLFHETVMQNIKLAKPGASKKEIIKAAKRAQAHDFIKKLPKGYDTVVGERGVKLSGGEKQRIAIARVFLEDPPILVLDEATSALDSKTEHKLQEALHEVMKNRTTIVIAHRLSTVMAADKILVIDKGKIVDSGTHQELIGRDSLYRDYWEIQACNYV